MASRNSLAEPTSFFSAQLMGKSRERHITHAALCWHTSIHIALGLTGLISQAVGLGCATRIGRGKLSVQSVRRRRRSRCTIGG